MNRCAWIVGLIAAALVMGGCKPKESAVAGAGKFRVALVLPGTQTDGGWNQMAAEGLTRVRDEMQAEVKIVTDVGENKQQSTLEYLAGDKYDLVICHGSEYQAAVEATARKYPGVHFVVGGCPAEIPGAVSVEFVARDGCTLAGVVAAAVSKSKTIAFVGAQKVPTLVDCYDGFKAGAGASVTVLDPQWTDDWSSSEKAHSKTKAVLAEGADVVFQNVDAAYKGVFQAIRDARTDAKPAWVFGCNGNQNDSPDAPGAVLGSVVIDVPRTYYEIARDARDGKWTPGLRRLGLKGGYVDLVPNEKNPALTPEVVASLNAARAALLAR